MKSTTTEREQVKNGDTMDMVGHNCQLPEPHVLTLVTRIVFRNIAANPLCREIRNVIFN